MRLTEDNIADYADTLVLQARGRGQLLDYSEASITQLEAGFRISDELLPESELSETQRNLLIFYSGCYLGEAMARNLGGVWNFEDNWFESSLVFPFPASGGIRIRPFDKILQRIAGVAEDNNLVSYYEGLKSRLMAGGE